MPNNGTHECSLELMITWGNDVSDFNFQFHIHTMFSSDSKLSCRKLYDALKKDNISGLAITDHNTISGALEFQQKYGDKLVVIVGEEIMSNRGEIIGLFLKQEIMPGLSPEKTIEQIKTQNGLVCIPHPFDNRRYRTCLPLEDIYNNRSNIDLIEIYNGRCMQADYNLKARDLCSVLQKTAIWGSDAHTVFEIQNNFITFNMPITRDNLLSELKNAKLSRPKLQKAVHWYTRYVRLLNLMQRGEYHEITKIIYRKCKGDVQRISPKS